MDNLKTHGPSGELSVFLKMWKILEEHTSQKKAKWNKSAVKNIHLCTDKINKSKHDCMLAGIALSYHFQLLHTWSEFWWESHSRLLFWQSMPIMCLDVQQETWDKHQRPESWWEHEIKSFLHFHVKCLPFPLWQRQLGWNRQATIMWLISITADYIHSFWKQFLFLSKMW